MDSKQKKGGRGWGKNKKRAKTKQEKAETNDTLCSDEVISNNQSFS